MVILSQHPIDEIMGKVTEFGFNVVSVTEDRVIGERLREERIAASRQQRALQLDD
ncbi:hypothetical protein V7799_02470 [Rhizobium laguerreae]